MTSRSEIRMPAGRMLAGLSLLSAMLLVVLIWQAVSGARAHLSLVQGVLRDYAALAAQQYEREIKGAIGYWGIYQPAERLAGPVAGVADRIDNWLAGNPQGTQLIGAIFSFDPNRPSGSVAVLHGQIDNWLVADLETALDSAMFADGPYSIVQFPSQRGTAVAAVLNGEGEQRLALLLDNDSVTDRFSQLFDSENLLPAALVGESQGNAGIYVLLKDTTGRELFRSEASYDPYARVRYPIGSDYGGLFEGYELSASIDPTMAPELVIGGLPYSRMLWLGLLIVVTLAVFTAAVRVAYKERAVARLREEFVARVSHELRTPLTQIRMFAETLLLDRVEDTSQRRRYLSIINREAVRLGHLVDNILTFSGREKAPVAMQMEEVNVADLLSEIIDRYQPSGAATAQLIDVECAPEITANVDREACQQVIINLLDNAAKYGPKDQVIRLRGTVCPDGIRISVSDDGPGVPERDRQRIWKPYERLSRDEERAVNGAGLGLAVANDLVVAMGGTCLVEEGATGGARFIIELPSAS